MLSVDNLAASQTSVSRAEVPYAIAARLLRVAAETGAGRQVLAGVQQAARAATESLAQAVTALTEGLDVYA